MKSKRSVTVTYEPKPGVMVVESLVDVESVISDGQFLWVDSINPLGVAKIPMEWVREIVGTDVAYNR